MQRALRVALVTAATLSLLVLAIRAQQYLFRHNAERLQHDISAFQYGRTTFVQAQPILRYWKASVAPDESCGQGSCSGRISVGDFAYRHSAFFSNHQRLLWAYGILGGRPAIVGADVLFRADVLRSKSFSVELEVFPHESAAFGFTPIGYSLLAENSVAETLPAWKLSVASQHPTYEVGSPGGCEVCISIWAHFTSNASETDVEKVGAIDLSCLSRWFQPCRLKDDVMPAAGQIERSEDPIPVLIEPASHPPFHASKH